MVPHGLAEKLKNEFLDVPTVGVSSNDRIDDVGADRVFFIFNWIYLQ